MDNSVRELSQGAIFFVGLILVIGGIIASIKGAWIIGLIVAAVNFHRWQKWNRHRAPTE